MTSPIAMPATGLRSGTPASISASEPAHTVAIDDEPFDSSVSPTTRITYGKVSLVGTWRTSARLARLPWPSSRRPTPRRRFASPVE